MKKSLIALAVLASTGAAMAQSSVTLYGIIDVNLSSAKNSFYNNQSNVRQNVEASGGVNTSRFGVKGSEDLGGGLKALFVLENGFNTDTGAAKGNLFGRASYVGLAGNFGEVRLGNVRTAYDDTSINSDALWDSNMSPAYSVWHQDYVATPGNSIYYATPSFAGFTAAISYALGENKTATVGAQGVVAANVQYANGPIYASLAYQEDKKSGQTPATIATALAADAFASSKDTLLNASYDFGVVKLEASYNRNETLAKVKADNFQIGVDVPVSSALVLSTGVAYSKDKSDSSIAGANGDKRSGFGLGAKYSLSKRTFVYTGLTLAESKPGAGGDKTKIDIYTIGLNHAF